MKTQYLVKWRDLSYRECTWEDADTLTDSDAADALRRFQRASRKPSVARMLSASGKAAMQNLNKDTKQNQSGRGSVVFPLTYPAPALAKSPACFDSGGESEEDEAEVQADTQPMAAVKSEVKAEPDAAVKAGPETETERKLEDDWAPESDRTYGAEEFLLLSANNQRKSVGAAAAIKSEVALILKDSTQRGKGGPRAGSKVPKPGLWGAKVALKSTSGDLDPDARARALAAEAEAEAEAEAAEAEAGSFTPYEESPSFFDEGHVLRDYQIVGVNWLLRNYYESRSCILADEMGLGKTVQVVTTCEHLRRNQEERDPFLVLAPLSTLPHWRREFEAWTPMTVCMYHDSGAVGTTARDMRSFIRKHEWFHADCSVVVTKFDVLILSYESLLADFDVLNALNWSVCVVDEGHRLKNNQSRLMQQMQLLTCKWRVLLSGTPLQNNTRELWSLLNFIEPLKFVDAAGFAQRYGTVTTQEQVVSLQEELMPHLLRRVKEDVEKDLPPKQETIIDVELTTVQKTYYRAIFEKNRSFLGQGCKAGHAPQLMNVQMQLRKCCNHPFLIRGVDEREMQSARARERESAPSGAAPLPQADLRLKSLVESSGKMVLVDKLLPKLMNEGHKTLIFSQMVMMLDIIQEYLELKGTNFERLDGRTTGAVRQKSIDRFCSPDNKSTFVFLLSTRAGGLGINLTAADTAIIFDSDWNPQNDLQAQARCHRIGQKKPVTIYRLLARNTFENELFSRAGKKLGLETAILGSIGIAEQGDGSLPDGRPGGAEMQELLRQGAYHLLDDPEAAAREQDFLEADVDKLLEQRARVFVHEQTRTAATLSGRAGHQLAKSSFKSEKADRSIGIDDPDFWQKVLGNDVSANALLVRLRGGEFASADGKGKEAKAKGGKVKGAPKSAAALLAARKQFMDEVRDLVDTLMDQHLGKVQGARRMTPNEIEAEMETAKRLLVTITQQSDVGDKAQQMFNVAQRRDAAAWLDRIEGSRVRSCRSDFKAEVRAAEAVVRASSDSAAADDAATESVRRTKARRRRAGLNEDDDVDDDDLDDILASDDEDAGSKKRGKKRARKGAGPGGRRAAATGNAFMTSVMHEGREYRLGDCLELNDVPELGSVDTDGSGASIPSARPLLAVIDSIRMDSGTAGEGGTGFEPVLEVLFFFRRQDTQLPPLSTGAAGVAVGGGVGVADTGAGIAAAADAAEAAGQDADSWAEEVFMTFLRHPRVPLRCIRGPRSIVFCTKQDQIAWLAHRRMLADSPKAKPKPKPKPKPKSSVRASQEPRKSKKKGGTADAGNVTDSTSADVSRAYCVRSVYDHWNHKAFPIDDRDYDEGMKRVLDHQIECGRVWLEEHLHSRVPAPRVGSLLEILWPDDGTWYRARVHAYRAKGRRHLVEYSADSTSEWLDFRKQKGGDAQGGDTKAKSKSKKTTKKDSQGELEWRVIESAEFRRRAPAKTTKAAGAASRSGSAPSQPQNAKGKVKGGGKGKAAKQQHARHHTAPAVGMRLEIEWDGSFYPCSVSHVETGGSGGRGVCTVLYDEGTEEILDLFATKAEDKVNWRVVAAPPVVDGGGGHGSEDGEGGEGASAISGEALVLKLKMPPVAPAPALAPAQAPVLAEKAAVSGGAIGSGSKSEKRDPDPQLVVTTLDSWTAMPGSQRGAIAVIAACFAG
eukprot:g3161.t1